MVQAVELDQIILTPLIDFHETGATSLAGVLVPKNEDYRSISGVTNQFLENAGEYHKKYFDIGYSKYLIDYAFKRIGMLNDVRLILDIGSGSGPSVLALLDRFPDSHVIATDVSPNLLAILRSVLKEVGQSDRCSTLCLDLNKRWFKGQAFDLAVGSAILHHLFRPELLVSQIFPSLKVGGAAVFFEPFEPGYAAMGLIYRTLIARAAASRDIESGITSFFQRKVHQIGLMRCDTKDNATYAEIDDKWLFTREFFQEIGREIGAARTIVAPINESDRPFSSHLEVQLRLGLGLPREALPDWAWDEVYDIEASISQRCKRDLLIEGYVAFVR